MGRWLILHFTNIYSDTAAKICEFFHHPMSSPVNIICRFHKIAQTFEDFTGDATKPLFLGAKMAFKTVEEFHLRAGKLQII